MAKIRHNRVMITMAPQQQQEHLLAVALVGDDALTRVATPVTDPTSAETQTLIRDMFYTMRIEKGCGLAAPQVRKNVRVITMDVDGTRWAMVNPEIISRTPDLVSFDEGCLSVPGKTLRIIRNESVTVRYHDTNGVARIVNAHGFLAVVCQHEIDHLDGILMTQRYHEQADLRRKYNIT